MQNTVAWHPDSRASLALAAMALMLVMTGFAALFLAAPRWRLSQDAEAKSEQLVLTEPMSSAQRPRHQMLAPVPRMPPLETVRPVLLAPVTVPRPITSQGYLDEREQQNAAALRDKVTAGDLQRELGRAAQKPALSDNQGYRTAGGQRIVRSGGSCAQIQTVQGSSSPTNHTNIAEPTSCPGDSPDAGEEIGKALTDWANKVQQAQKGPPGN